MIIIFLINFFKVILFSLLFSCFLRLLSSPDPGGPLCPAVLGLPAAGLSRTPGLPSRRPPRGLEPHQKEALHPTERCQWQARQSEISSVFVTQVCSCDKPKVTQPILCRCPHATRWWLRKLGRTTSKGTTPSSWTSSTASSSPRWSVLFAPKSL